jgi:hypothetical protein
MDDLVQRLRDWATDYKVNGVLKCVIYEAADRIEALERENAELKAKLKDADKECSERMNTLINNIIEDRRW